MNPTTTLSRSASKPGVGIEIVDETTLLAARRSIRAAVRSHPELSGLLFVNPVMALLDLGFRISPAMQRHISCRLGTGDDVSGELDAIEQELNEALQLPQPLTYSNPKHVARIVFEILAIRPRATADVAPPMKSADDFVSSSGYSPLVPHEATPKARPRNLARLHARRNNRRGHSPRHHHPHFALIDFDAALPELPFVDVAPSELPLEQLVFYRDAHPLIPKLCRYQALWRRRLALATQEPYHHIAARFALTSGNTASGNARELGKMPHCLQTRHNVAMPPR